MTRPSDIPRSLNGERRAKIRRSGNKEPRRICRMEKDGSTRAWEKMNNADLHTLKCLPDTVMNPARLNGRKR
jgi:hypothetical protein